MMSYLDQMGDTFNQGAGGGNTLFRPGELFAWEYPKIFEEAIEDEAKYWIPRQFWMVRHEFDENEVIKSKHCLEIINSKELESARYWLLFKDDLSGRNYRWQYLYRRHFMEKLLLEDTKFSRELLKVANSVKKRAPQNIKMYSLYLEFDEAGNVDVRSFVDYILHALAMRSTHTMMLSTGGLSKIAAKQVAAYVLLFTNFVFSKSTIIWMKNILKTFGNQNSNWSHQFQTMWEGESEEEMINIQPYRPFIEESTEWLEKDLSIVENAFLKPQSILFDMLCAYILEIKVRQFCMKFI